MLVASAHLSYSKKKLRNMIQLNFQKGHAFNENDLEIFSNKSGIVLPDNYILFLKDGNSGELSESFCYKIHTGKETVQLDYFYPFDSKKKYSCNPFFWKSCFDYLPRYLWPVATTSGHNKVLMSLDQDSRGAVFLHQTHSQVYKYHTMDEVNKDAGMTLLAPDFTSFLERIYID